MQRPASFRSGLSFFASLWFHVVAMVLLARADVRQVDRAPYEFEIADLPAPEPAPPPKPEREPEPEPELKPEIQPPTRPRPATSRQPPQPVEDAPVDEEPVEDEPPPRFELPPDQIARGSGTGVRVHVGNTRGGVPGGTGDPSKQGKGSRPRDAETTTDPGAPVWKPRTEMFIKRLPEPVRVPEIQCPAVRELGIAGTVVLAVQVQRDGKVRKVRVVSGIGNGCDNVARQALRKAKFRPAVATDGKAADYELRYEYVFQLDE